MLKKSVDEDKPRGMLKYISSINAKYNVAVNVQGIV